MKAFVCAMLFALPLAAQSALRITPPVAVDAHTAVDIDLHGDWSDSNTPFVRRVTVTGRAIEIHLGWFEGVAEFVITPWDATAHVGTLPAGIYTVSAMFDNDPQFPAEHATLIVRDDHVIVYPAAIPLSGGDATLFDDFTWLKPSDADPIVQISVDGGPFLDVSPPALAVHVPAHAAGTVDIVAKRKSGAIVAAPAAITFFDPAAPLDLTLFEPVVFPVSVNGAGRFGSQWSTSNVISAWYRSWFRTPLPCDGCTTSLLGRAVLPASGAASGQVLYAVRGTTYFVTGSNVTEQTHGAIGRVPVLRDKDFISGGLGFAIVPHLKNTRATLRVWLFTAAASAELWVQAHSTTKSNIVYPIATRSAPDQPLFVSFDLNALLDSVDDGTYINMNVSTVSPNPYEARLAAIISVTDNTTQQMTIIASQ